MEQYNTPSQTFVLLSSVERDAMLATLTQALDYIKKHGEPSTWNDHDRGILTKMIYLCGPIGHCSDHLDPHRVSIGLDPTESQIKKINKALAKLAITALPLPTKTTPVIQSGAMARRMKDRRDKMLNWVTRNQKNLRLIAAQEPRIIASLGSVGDGTPHAADIEMAATIADILTRHAQVDPTGLFEF